MEGGNALSLLLPIALFVIMLGMGLTLKTEDFSRIWRQLSVVGVGALCQLLLLPAIAFGVVILTDLPALLACGLMIVAFAPGGATSNMISHLCRGDTALSISLTALTSLVVPFTLPWLAWITLEHFMGQGEEITLPFIETAAKLLLITILPVVFGVMINRRWPVLCLQLQRPVKIVSLVFMFAVVGMISWANRERLPELLPVLTPAVLLLACGSMLLDFSFCYGGLKYSKAVSLTLAIETSIQNAGTALFVTGALLQQPEMSLAALMYGILMQLPAFLLIIWRNLPFVLVRESVNTQ